MSFLKDSQEQQRLYLRFRTSNVPGEAGKRNEVLTKDLCHQLLGRQISQETDHVYVSGLYDKPNQVAYLIFDLNISGSESRLEDIPLSCYKVSYTGNTA
jgi:hypothetical protein